MRASLVLAGTMVFGLSPLFANGAAADDDDAPRDVIVAGDPIGVETGDDDDEGIEREDIFGFTEGGGVGEAGDREVSTTAVVGNERRGVLEDDDEDGDDAAGDDENGDDDDGEVAATRSGSVPIDYTALSAETELEYTLTDRLKISGGFTTAYFDTRFPGEFRNHGLEFGGLSAAVKYSLLRAGEEMPVNLALAAEGEWERFSEETGDRLNSYGLAVGLLADTAIIPETLFGAANFTFSTETGEPEPGEEDEGWEKESGLEATAALSYRLLDRLFVGAETRFSNAFEGSFLDERVGHALYVGPTAYLQLSDAAYLKAAWSRQVSGRSDADPHRSLNLVDFSRDEILAGFGYEF